MTDELMKHVMERITDHELDEAEVRRAMGALTRLDDKEQLECFHISNGYRKLVNGKNIAVGLMAAAHAMAVITASTTKHEPSMGEHLLTAAYNLADQMRTAMVEEDKNDA